MRGDRYDSQHSAKLLSAIQIPAPGGFRLSDDVDTTGCADYAMFVASGLPPVFKVVERSDRNR